MKRLYFTLIACFFLSSACLKAQTFPVGFSVQQIGSGWVQPVGAVFDPTGTKLFVWQQGGTVYLLNWNSVTKQYDKQTTPLLDISDEVGNWDENGMLGFTIDPNFNTNGLIYALYVVDREHLLYFGTGSYDPNANFYYQASIGRITRYHVTTSGSDLVADPASRTVLLGESITTGIPVIYDTHGVGSLVFARDGTLLASVGESGSASNTDTGSLADTYFSTALSDGIIRPAENVGAFRSQMVNSLSGKILRLDPATGDGLSSNPFYDALNPRSPQSRVWAMGFRNPFRFSIKPNTGSLDPNDGDVGTLYVGDVGYSHWEELDIINQPAANCGWPIFEGFTTTNGYDTVTVNDQDEPNPLYDGVSCTQQYFTFENLLKQATADNDHTVFNPCNNSQPITGENSNRYFHWIPAIDWRHKADSARVGVFTGNTLGIAQIGTPGSGVTGTPFRGNTCIGGCWYTGTMYPLAWRNTYFHADFGGKWLKSFVMQNDSVKVVQDFGSAVTGIVSLVQNPRDGGLVYADVIDGLVNEIVYSATPLPLNLVSFTVTPKSNGNFAKWVTESEAGVDSFILERSTNGFDFSPIHKQVALNRPGQNQYNFNDNSFPAGDLYYRLKMMDQNGQFKYSEIVKITNNLVTASSQLFVIPNPVLSTFSLQGNFAEREQIQIIVTDASGRRVSAFEETVNAGLNNIPISHLQKLQPGIYFIEAKGTNTNRKTKFLKIQ